MEISPEPVIETAPEPLVTPAPVSAGSSGKTWTVMLYQDADDEILGARYHAGLE